jgi:rhodanese-related sulfurtransferase
VRAPARFAPAPDAVIRDLSPQDAWEAFQLHIPFLDARRSADYQAGHVAGAWSVPIWEADADARITDFEARAKPAAKSPLVLYCAGGDCQDSRVLADKLVGLGYRNLFIYRDGFPDWARRGRPQQRGPRP